MHLMFGAVLSGDTWLAPVGSSSVYTDPNTVGSTNFTYLAFLGSW
jgi:hypothetical protein